MLLYPVYATDSQTSSALRHLVFDSKFTTYQNLAKMNEEGIRFLTLRRRGSKFVEKIEALPASAWKSLKVECADGHRTIRLHDSTVFLKGHDGEIRQIAIIGHGRMKPALLITNDFSTPAGSLIRSHARRWQMEKGISEQIYFFHLNRVSSSIVIKYEQCQAETLFNKFIDNMGSIRYGNENVEILLKKKRELPLLLEMAKKFEGQKVPWTGKRSLAFSDATIS